MPITSPEKLLSYKNIVFILTIALLLIFINKAKAENIKKETPLKMQLSVQTQKAYQFLKNWKKKKSVLDLQRLLDFEINSKLERVGFEHYFSYNLSPFLKDQFYAFAVDGSGGYYAFWVTAEATEEYPVVLIDSEGEHDYLASSLWQFIHNIPKNPNLTEYINEYYDDMIDDYNELHGVELSQKEIKAKLNDAIKLFQTEIKRLEKTPASDITAQDFKKLLKELDAEQDRLENVIAQFSKQEKVELTENDQKSFSLTFIKNIKDAYSYMNNNLEKHVTMYWYGNVHDNLIELQNLSVRGYNRFLPAKETFKTWKEYMLPKLEKKLATLSKQERLNSISVKQLEEAFDYFISR